MSVSPDAHVLPGEALRSSLSPSPRQQHKNLSRHPPLYPNAPQSMPDEHADSGLPPTPPTILPDERSTQDTNPPSHAGSLVSSLVSKKSSLSTPVNGRSPPTPDPSPPRAAAAASSSVTAATAASLSTLHLIPYPSSRAESFKTAREDPISADSSDCHSLTPVRDRLPSPSLLSEPGDDITPIAAVHPVTLSRASPAGRKESPVADHALDREWKAEFVRNVTIRKKRKSPSPPPKAVNPSFSPLNSASPTCSVTGLRSASLRQRVEASSQTPHTSSVQHFAHSIGWPAGEEKTWEQKPREGSNTRLSTSSVASTVVEAMVIMSPPRRTQTLRHSGRNMAYRRDVSSPAVLGSDALPKQGLTQSDSVLLPRLVHKRASVVERWKRASADSDTLGEGGNGPLSASLYPRTRDSSAYTLAHQESVRRILQPAADSLSRHHSLSYHRISPARLRDRVSSAPEPTITSSTLPRRRQALPVPSVASTPASDHPPSQSLPSACTSSPVVWPGPTQSSPTSRKQGQRQRQRTVVGAEGSVDAEPSHTGTWAENKEQRRQHAHLNEQAVAEDTEEKHAPPAALVERVRRLVAQREREEEKGGGGGGGGEEKEEEKAAHVTEVEREPHGGPASTEPPTPSSSIPSDRLILGRGSYSFRARSIDPRRGSLTQERPLLSPETGLRPSPDQLSAEDTLLRNHEGRRLSENTSRPSFDRSTIRTEEHAMARHLFAQETPFSQVSDTPIEVSEATAVSIFPHNNHSLLVVQQVSRVHSLFPEPGYLESDGHLALQNHQGAPLTPPCVDAGEIGEAGVEKSAQPSLIFEPSTPPPMQVAPVQPGAMNSPLKNPRPPPEPPKIHFIPPTPAGEPDRQLTPGPPKRSTSHPQRRLSLAQRARRYSDNLIPILLARASSNRGRAGNNGHLLQDGRKGHVPTVNEEDGSLHPFWRPRGFWDDFDDSDGESDGEEGPPMGGDTSDAVQPPKRSNTLSSRLASGIKGSGGFLIGNSLGVERHGTNRRPHRVSLPPNFSRMRGASGESGRPQIVIQPPTLPLAMDAGGRVSKRRSRGHLRFVASSDKTLGGRASWRRGRRLPGLKRYQVQYIGLSGVKKRLRERAAEKRREKLRRSIGPRRYVEPGEAWEV